MITILLLNERAETLARYEITAELAGLPFIQRELVQAVAMMAAHVPGDRAIWAEIAPTLEDEARGFRLSDEGEQLPLDGGEQIWDSTGAENLGGDPSNALWQWLEEVL